MRILVVEDDAEAATAMVRGLTEAGHEPTHAVDGAFGLLEAQKGGYDVYVVDRMMPRLDGIGMVETLRKDGDQTPVLFLSALGEVEDRVTGLKAGADDYLVKPFQKDELLARLNALVRRSAGFISPRVKAGDYELDLSRKELTIAGEVTVLTSFEYLILEYLMRNARQVVSKQQLLDQLYGDGEGDPNTIEVMVAVETTAWRRIDRVNLRLAMASRLVRCDSEASRS